MTNNVKAAYLTYGIVAVVLLQLLVFISGKDSYVTIHDNLDSEFTYLKALKDEALLLDSPPNAKVNSIMNGLPRKFMRSPYHLTPLIFNTFPSFTTYIINKLLVRIIAFVGMFLILIRYFPKIPPVASAAMAFAFSSIGFYHIQYGISVAGQPLLLYAFLNILNGRKELFNWIILLLFPVFSFFAVVVPFVIPALLIISLIERQKLRNQYMYIFLAIALLFIGYTITEWQIIYQIFQPGNELSHRVEFSLPENRSFDLGSLIGYLKYTHYHVGIMKTEAIWYLLILAIVLRKRVSQYVWIMVLSIVLIATLHLNYDWIKADVLKPIGLSFMNLSRFYFLLPTIWFLLFASLISSFRWSSPLTKFLFTGIILWVGIDIFKRDPEFMNNEKLMFSIEINEPTYRQFYATELFKDVIGQIEKETDQPKVLSLGMYPNIALFNGLSVLDSYQNNYTLSYKKRFRKIIAKELDKSEQLRNYFDDWGSRCYVFSSELGKNYLFSKNSSTKIINLEIDIQAIKELQGTHLLSAIPIENANMLSISLSETFEHPEAHWKIWLYRINN